MSKMNCIVVDDDSTSRKILSYHIEKTGYLNLVKECDNAFEARKYLDKHEVDLIFLDVEMPQMTGLEFIDILTKRPLTILVSGKKDYAADGYDLDVIDFLLKPVSLLRFQKASDKALALFENEIEESNRSSEKNIFIKVDSAWIKIYLDTILYVQAMADYVSIFIKTSNGVKRHVIHSTMKAVEEKLGFEDFIRIHRSYIINQTKITSLNGDMVQIEDHTIPVGVTYKGKIEDIFSKLNS